MQTVDHSSPSAAIVATPVGRKPDLHSMRAIAVRPVVPRPSTVLAREERQIAEDGGEAEARRS